MVGPFIGSEMFHYFGLVNEFFVVNAFVIILIYLIYKNIPCII